VERLVYNMSEWIEGRQGSGYFKKLIFQGPFFDCYLLKFPEGSCVHWHTDPVPGKRHWRLNIFLKQCERGGHFIRKGFSDNIGARFQLFRPDIQEHMVTPVDKGVRYVLSIGVVL
jgi:hypothetical protein